MNTDIRSCRPNELAQLVSLLDEEFIFGKGRTISLQSRFPTVFCHKNLHNIMLCKEGKKIVSALAMRHFDWIAGGKMFRGTMIGTVYTHPTRRGEGLASRLLAAAAMQLRELSMDFGVLWTEQQSFYAHLGWVAADCGMLGETKSDNFGAKSSGDVVRMQMSAGASLAEDLRQRWMNNTNPRQPEDYRHLPLPAERVDFLWHEDQGKVAYALLGSNGATGYLYELVGDTSCFPALWRETCCNHRQFIVNVQADSSSYCWLTNHTKVSWKNKNLAMWLPLSKRVDMSRLEQWHIPYFDRI